MKKQDVRMGATYLAKVSGGIAKVRIESERWLGDEHKGWMGVNVATGRAVIIKSAQRLRAAVAAVGAVGVVGEKVAPVPNVRGDVGPGGEGTPEVVGAAGSPKPPKGGAKGGKSAKATGGQKPETTPAKSEAKKAKVEKPAKTNGPMSGLDAAATVLAEAKKPMTCKEIVAAAFTRKYWRSEGATPEATIYAAIIREISAKGGEARFKKTQRGHFAIAGKGA